jgi:hypothetical protein
MIGALRAIAKNYYINLIFISQASHFIQLTEVAQNVMCLIL